MPAERTRTRSTAALAALLGMALLASPPALAAGDRCRGQSEPIRKKAQLPRGERILLCMINVHRAAHGRPALAHDRDLRRAARKHSRDMVARRYFSHTSPGGRSPGGRAAAAGYGGRVGENIVARARRAGTAPRRLFRAWRRSAGHNRNMLSRSYRVSGIGLAKGFPSGGRGITATAMFGTRASEASDTAVDLLVTRACVKVRKLLKRASRRVRRASARLRRAERSGSEEELTRARRRLMWARNRRERIKARRDRTCNAKRF